MHCNGVKCVASCNTMYQNYQDPSLPSGSDILRYFWTCRASAIYDMPINWRYIQKRCPALVGTHTHSIHVSHIWVTLSKVIPHTLLGVHSIERGNATYFWVHWVCYTLSTSHIIGYTAKRYIALPFVSCCKL